MPDAAARPAPRASGMPTPETSAPATTAPGAEVPATRGGATAPLPPSQAMLCFALYSASHAMHRVYRPWLDRMGLTYPQFLAMTALWARDGEAEGQTVGELCAELRLATSTLTPVLKRIEALGLARRTRDPRDARAVRISLTDEGRALRARTEGLGEALLAASGLDLRAARAFQAEISDLRDRLTAYADARDGADDAPDPA